MTNDLQNTLHNEEIAPNVKLHLGSTISGNGIITLVRGDTFQIKADLNIGTPLHPVIFELENDDYVVFRLFTANSSWGSYLLEKEATLEDLDSEGNIVFNLSSEDSESINQGQYYYQIRLFYTRDGETRVITLMPRTKFYMVD